MEGKGSGRVRVEADDRWGLEMADTKNWNDPIIQEFRANRGKVGGSFDRQPLLLLHHRGARSDVERVNPLAYQKVGDSYAVFATKGGSPTNPDWYHNLVAHPRAKVEVGTDTVDVNARVARGEEREGIWEEQKRLNPNFGDYEERTEREIPVIVLDPVRSD
jgi:deazaflavin-dependent oxidoreductase (nitroreductase family)